MQLASFQLRQKIKFYFTQYSKMRRIRSFDIVVFLRQFATLIAAGIPMLRSCDILEKSQEKIAMRLLIYSIKREIGAGKHLFTSFERHPLYFDHLTCQLIRIGEHTGKLDSMLLAVATQQENSLAFKRNIQRILFYPCILLITALFIICSLFIFVIPKFAELFSDKLDNLPVLTIWLFHLSFYFREYFFIGIGILLLSFIIFLNKKSAIRSFLQKLNNLPILKQYKQKISLARFARHLAITFTAGIPIIQALKLTENNNAHMTFNELIPKLRHKIQGGLALHQAMQLFPYFPLLMVQMIKIGEESGTLERMLSKIADFLEAEVAQFVSQLSQLLEPLIILVLGVLIGGLVIGMYLPIFKLGSAL